MILPYNTLSSAREGTKVSNVTRKLHDSTT